MKSIRKSKGIDNLIIMGDSNKIIRYLENENLVNDQVGHISNIIGECRKMDSQS